MIKDFLHDKSKFALIAISHAYTDFDQPDDFSHKLTDGTWILSKLPITIDEGWQDWIGSIQYRSFAEANLVLLYSERTKNPELLDAHHNRLGERLSHLFQVLQLQGVVEYQESNLVLGSFYDNRSELRQMAKLPQFYPTKGYDPQPVSVVSLEEAFSLRMGLEEINKAGTAHARLIRGWNVLMDGFQRNVGEERIHQFARSLEALILPNVGKTKRQFIHRCQTFAAANKETIQILSEAFDLRSMSEHVNDWQPALGSYPQQERENLALLRTRQIERLSSFAYSRIIGDSSIRSHFISETKMQEFWQLRDNRRRAIWGNQLDLRSIT